MPFGVGLALPEVWQLMSQTPKLLYVERRQRGQPFLSFRCRLQSDHPMVIVVVDASQQRCRFGAIHEARGAVVAQQQLVGDVADLGPRGSTCPRTASSSWCWAGVSPAALAWASLQCWNRRKPVRRASNRR